MSLLFSIKITELTPLVGMSLLFYIKITGLTPLCRNVLAFFYKDGLAPLSKCLLYSIHYRANECHFSQKNRGVSPRHLSNAGLDYRNNRGVALTSFHNAKYTHVLAGTFFLPLQATISVLFSLKISGLSPLVDMSFLFYEDYRANAPCRNFSLWYAG
jgi:hypothetical protein